MFVHRGVDTVMALCVTEYGLVGPRDVDPPLQLQPGIRIRILRTSNRHAIHESRMMFRGFSRRLLEWGAEDAQAFRDESQRAVEYLAGRISDELL